MEIRTHLQGIVDGVNAGTMSSDLITLQVTSMIQAGYVTKIYFAFGGDLGAFGAFMGKMTELYLVGQVSPQGAKNKAQEAIALLPE